MGDFEVDTRIEPVDADSGVYAANLSRDWEIWGPNGGYLAAIALRAVGREAQIPRPASFTGHFLRVARFDPVQIRVTAVHRGRRSESFEVRIEQEGRAVFTALVRTAAEGPGLEHDVARRPEVPDPETLQTADALRNPDEPRHAFWRNLDARPVWPERFDQKWVRHEPIWHEWYRFRPRATFEDPFLDAGRMLLLIDTLSWPAACQPHPEPDFQAPNLDVTAWFYRSDPKGEWLFADHDCTVAEAGLMGTTGRVWSRDGRLLAAGGAQLMCVPAQPRG